MKAHEVYNGSEGALTRAYYAALEQRGPAGIVAVNLFRAQKCSTRAKKYRGGVRGVGSYRGMAYDRKAWSMGNLCAALAEHGEALGIAYGWKRDPLALTNPWVLYVDLPNGQVSFHSPTRGEGSDYAGEWDAMHASEQRILAFCDGVMHGIRVDVTNHSTGELKFL